jgi:hypothetical protein
MKKSIVLLLLTILIYSCSHRLTPTEAIYKLGANPYFEVDGNPVDRSYLDSINSNEIASLTTFYDKDAISMFGEKSKDGAVLIETKTFARNKFETLFKKFSLDYEALLKHTERNEIQYILNGRVLVENYEGDLVAISEKTLKRITIIRSKELEDKYQVKDKKAGVIIEAERPRNLYNSKKKF